MRLVRIEWIDAHHYESGKWSSKSEAVSSKAIGVKVTTVGILLKESSEYYTICSTVAEGDQVTGVFNVPRAVVQEITDI